MGEILQWACCGEKLVTALAQDAVNSAKWTKGMGELGESMKIFKEGQGATRLEQEMWKGVESYLSKEKNIILFGEEIVSVNRTTQGGGVILNGNPLSIVHSASY
jgi:hypothetical protein